MQPDIKRTTLQYRAWRWHFFAALIVVPFAVAQAISGGVYLFKTQIEALIEDGINKSASGSKKNTTTILPADDLIAVAKASYPKANFIRFTMSKKEDRTVEIELSEKDGNRVVWVDQYTGEILNDVAKSERIMEIAKDIHGNLMFGKVGSLVVELMMSWMIILIITGSFLWFPRKEKLSNAFLPSTKPDIKREKWRSIHGSLGALVGWMVLILLLSGLPWTQVWGEGFKQVQKFMGWDGPGQEWFVTLQSEKPMPKKDGIDLWQTSSGDDEVSLKSGRPVEPNLKPISLQQIVDIVGPQDLPTPIEIQPPKGSTGVWTVRSMTPDRPHRITVHYDRWTAKEIMRIKFTDHHPVQRIASYGIALHEGALFGPINQFLGLIASLGVIALSVTGPVMWWKRRPKGQMGVPPIPSDKSIAIGIMALIFILGILLPLVGISLIVALFAEFVWEKWHVFRSRLIRD